MSATRESDPTEIAMNKLLISPGCKRVRAGTAPSDKFDLRNFPGAVLSTGSVLVPNMRIDRFIAKSGKSSCARR